MTNTLRIHRLFLYAGVLVVVWSIFALFSSSEFYQRGMAVGSKGYWTDVIQVQLSTGLLWAAFTPVIVFIALRLPLQKPHRLRNAVALFLLTIVIAAARAVVGGVVSAVSEGDTPTWGFIMLSLTIRFHRNVFLTLVIIGITNLVLANRRAADRELAALATKADLLRSEFRQLRTSLQPQFVMSTLDAIAARVKESPAAADRILVELADLLRARLEYQKRREVTVTEELELVDRYVDIQKILSRGRFRCRVDVNDDALDAEMPPLLLLVVVESVLVAPGDGDEGWLEIRGSAEHGTLRLEVRNGGNRRDADGQALEETRARLEQTFSGTSSIRVERAADCVITIIEMPLRQVAAGAAS